MKILVLSDSHGSLTFMQKCADAIKPDAIVHLGDFYDDGNAIRRENPQIPFFQVPGNCDASRCPPSQPQTIVTDVLGAKLYMTHGHLHRVKLTQHFLLRDARNAGAQAALYGHTHTPDCRQESDGLWVLNPGSSRFGSTAGIMEIENGKIISCRILRQEDLEGEI